MALSGEGDVLERFVKTLDLSDVQDYDMLQQQLDNCNDNTTEDTETEKAMNVELETEDRIVNNDVDNNASNYDWASVTPDEANTDNSGNNYKHVELDFDHAALMDIQLVYHQGRGALIKEMAFKGFNCGIVYNLNFAHDIADVPAHLVIKRGYGDKQRNYHRFTGLNLESGDFVYEDQRIVALLNGIHVVFLKGANKKSTLISVFDRLEIGDSGGRPTVVNIDGHTADDADRLFCKTHGIALATFSFSYVYTNFNAFMNTIVNSNMSNSPYMDIVHVNNVLANDVNSCELFGRGRVICVCHSDHSRDGATKTFGTKQRCSLLNLSILYYLWFGWRYDEFAALVQQSEDNRDKGVVKCDRNEKRDSSLPRKRHCQQNVVSRNGDSYMEPQIVPRRPKTPLPGYTNKDRQRRSHVTKHYCPYSVHERHRYSDIAYKHNNSSSGEKDNHKSYRYADSQYKSQYHGDSDCDCHCRYNTSYNLYDRDCNSYYRC